MSTPKQSVQSYLLDAKALARLFPSLKRYARRKTLKPQEKSAIARARNIWEIVQLPNAERPKHLRNYTFPVNRKRSIESYTNSARRLEELDPSMKRYRGRKRLKPGEKARIRYFEKRVKNISVDLEPVSQAEKKKLNKIAPGIIFPIKGLNALKLKQIPASGDPALVSYKREILPNGMRITTLYKTGVRRVWLFVYTGANIALIEQAANYLKAVDDGDQPIVPDYLPFDKAARQLYIWTNHGRTAAGQPNTQRLLAQLGDENALQELGESSASLAANITSGGFALVFGKPDGNASMAIGEEMSRYKNEDALKAAVEGTWILGVIGFFEQAPK